MGWTDFGVSTARTGAGYEGWWVDNAGKRRHTLSCLSEAEAAWKLARLMPLPPLSAEIERAWNGLRAEAGGHSPDDPTAEQVELVWWAIKFLESKRKFVTLGLTVSPAEIDAIGDGPVSLHVHGCNTHAAARYELRRMVYWRFGDTVRSDKLVEEKMREIWDDPASRAVCGSPLIRLFWITASRVRMAIKEQAMMLFPPGAPAADFAWSVSRVEVAGATVTQLQLDSVWPVGFPASHEPDTCLDGWAEDMARRWDVDESFLKHWRLMHSAAPAEHYRSLQLDAELEEALG
ncbi:hypothetical protein [Emcibacter sp. SYSU 3D8]|uniref:hypothetical protein n=1 Tax=Emcibacter sp. SYSU 3D8 TaxID=3133969 RepID=UPI0031FE4F22